jgi:predicted O-linked N-acetylglucosamine transferase (SPINDLY family)
MKNGVVTFGSFHNLAKLGDAVIETWAELLGGVPGSRLVIMAKGLAGGNARLLESFAQRGVEVGRIVLRNAVPYREYLESYADVDIALDTFPYSGGTTTCESLWMGVPVVTWAYPSHPGRSAASILSAVGLQQWVVDSREQYIRAAVDLAGNLTELAFLRSGLRERMRVSPLMDETRFAADMAEAYVSLWRAWCRQQTSSGA